MLISNVGRFACNFTCAVSRRSKPASWSRPVSSVAMLALCCATPAWGQTAPSADQKSTELPRTVVPPDRNAEPKQSGKPAVTAPQPAPSDSPPGATAGRSQTPLTSGSPTPLNSNVVASSSNLLGLPVFQTPASVQVV